MVHPGRLHGGTGNQWRKIRNRFSGRLLGRRGNLIAAISDMWHDVPSRTEQSYLMSIQRVGKTIIIPKPVISGIMPETNQRIEDNLGVIWEIRQSSEDQDMLKWRCVVTQMEVH